MNSLKQTLDRFYREYNFPERLIHDPISFPRSYACPEDREVAGFMAACLAYGKVGLFRPVIGKILAPAGDHPASFFRNFSLKRDGRFLRGISYRFNREEDILCLVYIVSRALKQWGSLKNLFYHFYREDHVDIKIALQGFIDYLTALDTTPVYKSAEKPYGLLQLLPSPRKGSACKRLNLFLRWMVRNRDIDLGIWDRIPASKLIIPLDTHILRIARCIGLTDRTSPDWRTAGSITVSLRKLDPEDPLKYDFALCHQGISGLCRGRRFPESCSACSLSL